MGVSLTQEELKKILSYDENTGCFRWLVSLSNRSVVGSIAGRQRKVNEYSQITINKKTYGAHQLAYLYVHGYIPDMIDHRDTNRGNNRIDNLRPASKSENGSNTGRKINNTTGYKGVFRDPRYGTYQAKIMKNGKIHHLGSFSSAEKAHQAYCHAAKRLHDVFFNPG